MPAQITFLRVRRFAGGYINKGRACCLPTGRSTTMTRPYAFSLRLPAAPVRGIPSTRNCQALVLLRALGALRVALLLALPVLCFGCMPSYTSQELLPAPVSLVPGRPVYVALPRNPPNDNEGIGALTGTMLVQNLALYSSKVELGTSVETRQPALASARKAGAAYLFIATLVNWREVEHPIGSGSSVGLFLTAFAVDDGRMLSMREIWAVDESLWEKSKVSEHAAEVLRRKVGEFFVSKPVVIPPAPSPASPTASPTVAGQAPQSGQITLPAAPTSPAASGQVNSHRQVDEPREPR